MSYELEGWGDLRPPIVRALDRGVSGVAVLNPTGEPIAMGGWLQRDEVRRLAALVTKQAPPDLRDRMLTGELATATADGRTVYLGIAARCVFVLVVADVLSTDLRASAQLVRAEIELAMEARRRSVEIPSGWPPPPIGSSGSGSPPAEAFLFWPSTFRGRSQN